MLKLQGLTLGVYSSAYCLLTNGQGSLKNTKLKNYFWYVVFGLMLAHTRYFGTLQTAIIGCLGLFFITKKQFKSYFITNRVLLLLFFPYIPYLQ
jgi:hypothetical protein